jgi:hypothetical protein
MVSIVLLMRTNLFFKKRKFVAVCFYGTYLLIGDACFDLNLVFFYWCESVWDFNNYGTYGNGCIFDGTYLLIVDMCWGLYLVECNGVNLCLNLVITVPCFQSFWWIELFLLIMRRFVITYWRVMHDYTTVVVMRNLFGKVERSMT